MDGKLLIRRFIAFLIDWNIMFGVAMAIMFFGPGNTSEYFLYPSIKMFTSPGFLLGIAWLFLYCLFKDCLFGRRSLGKLICGLAIQSSETGEKASFGSLILRNKRFLQESPKKLLTLCAIPFGIALYLFIRFKTRNIQ